MAQSQQRERTEACIARTDTKPAHKSMERIPNVHRVLWYSAVTDLTPAGEVMLKVLYLLGAQYTSQAILCSG